MINKSMLKKIIVSFSLALFLLISVSTSSVKALEGGSWYNQSFKEWYSKVYDDSNPNEIFGERYTAGQVQWILYSFPAIIMNQIIDPSIVSCFMQGSLDECIEPISNKLISEQNNNIPIAINKSTEPEAEKSLLVDYLETNPVSGVGYIISRLQNMGVAPEAQAQGFGFTQLQNVVLDLWKASRNISYALFVIMIVITAFMIMFRVKISPQAVISVQSSLPKIAIALVLITFSYAIAGFLIDLVYVLIGLVSTIFTSTTNILPGTEWRDLFDYLIKGPLNTGILGILSQYATIATITYLSVAIQATFSSSFFAGVLLLILTLIIPILFGFIMIFQIIKALWFFLKTYLNIILLIIFAPLQIAAGIVIPSVGFGTWIKSLLANLAVYPVVSVLIIISFIFLAEAAGPLISALLNVSGSLREVIFGSDSLFPFRFDADLVGKNVWSPPLTLGSGSLQSLLFLGASYATIVMIPKVGEMIKSMIEGKPFGYGTAIGESISGPVGGGLKAIGVATDVSRAWTTRLGTRDPKAAPSRPKPLPTKVSSKP
jgi:hypothetical protein